MKMILNCKKIILLPLIIMGGVAGCSTIENEIRTAAHEGGTATGSDFVTQICGWNSTASLAITSFKKELTPNSTSRNGSGIVDIVAEGDGFTCGGKIFITYSTEYTGSHGLGGSNDIRFGIIRRESDVVNEISSPENATELKIGEKKTGSVSDRSYRLPDGSYAEFYYVDLKGDNPAIKVVTTTLSKDFIVRGSMYQNYKLVSGLSFFGTKFKQGRVYLLVTGGKNKGQFTITVDELSNAEKANLK